MRPVVIPWVVFIIPIIAVHGAYAIGWFEGVAFQCNPYWHGCTSISRAARMGNAIYFFRPLMMPLAAVLMLFWWMQYVWLKHITGKGYPAMLILGIIGAAFLVLYANFLGTYGEAYGLMRRFGVIVYFGFTVLAQLLSIVALHKLGSQLDSKLRFYSHIQVGLILFCMLLGLANLIFKSLGFIWASAMENTIEWHFALYMSLYFPLAAAMWKHTQYRWQALTQQS